jgi:hypothetical protein
VLLGDNTLVYLVLALGAALVVGNVLALVRPPAAPKDGELEKAPKARTVTMALVGLVASIWAIASLVSS